jgi:hypothetical protein
VRIERAGSFTLYGDPAIVNLRESSCAEALRDEPEPVAAR